MCQAANPFNSTNTSESGTTTNPDANAWRLIGVKNRRVPISRHALASGSVFIKRVLLHLRRAAHSYKTGLAGAKPAHPAHPIQRKGLHFFEK